MLSMPRVPRGHSRRLGDLWFLACSQKCQSIVHGYCLFLHIDYIDPFTKHLQWESEESIRAFCCCLAITKFTPKTIPCRAALKLILGLPNHVNVYKYNLFTYIWHLGAFKCFIFQSCQPRESDLFQTTQRVQPWYFGQKGRIRRAWIEFQGQIDYLKVCSLCSGPNGAEVALRMNVLYTDAETWVKNNSCVMLFM